MSAKIKGKEVRAVVSFRMEPRHKAMLQKHHGSMQAAIEYLVGLTILEIGEKKRESKTKAVPRNKL